jgi:hypothetical protein
MKSVATVTTGLRRGQDDRIHFSEENGGLGTFRGGFFAENAKLIVLTPRRIVFRNSPKSLVPPRDQAPFPPKC